MSERVCEEDISPAQIMMIDDEPDLRELAKICFERENYNVLTAPHGKAGLEILEETNPDLPDLILLGIHMPELDGWATLSEMDKRSFLKRIPVFYFYY